MSSELDILAKRLREEREKRGWSIRKLEAKSGVSNSAITLIEKNRRSPKLDTIYKLAAALEIPAPYLAGMTDEPDPKGYSGVPQNKPLPHVSERETGFGTIGPEEKKLIHEITEEVYKILRERRRKQK